MSIISDILRKQILCNKKHKQKQIKTFYNANSKLFHSLNTMTFAKRLLTFQDAENKNTNEPRTMTCPKKHTLILSGFVFYGNFPSSFPRKLQSKYFTDFYYKNYRKKLYMKSKNVTTLKMRMIRMLNVLLYFQ